MTTLQFRIVLAGVCLVGAALGALVIALRHGAWTDGIVLLTAALAVGIGAGLPVLLHIRRVLRAHDLVLDSAHDGAFEWHPITKELRVGRRLLAILGYPKDAIDNTHAWLRLVHPEDRARYNQAVGTHLKGLTDHFYCEYRVKASNGQYRWLAARGMAVRNAKGIATLMAGSVSDITERMVHEQRIRDLALNDQLTSLPNRRSLMKQLPIAIAAAQRTDHRLAVLSIDLDRFKDINDLRGHLAGDALLTRVARRIPSALRSHDMLFRHGGDEFTVILTHLVDPREALDIAQCLLASITDPLTTDDSDLRITASIGIGFFPDNGDHADALLACANIAVASAKSAGGNAVRCFEPSMQERMRNRVSMESRLRSAIDNGDLVLHYQPQQCFADGALIGAEALVRWNDGGHLVPPDQFIGLAEENGLIEPLGRWVMTAAIRQRADWRGRCPENFRIAINLSPSQLVKQTVEHELFQASAHYGVEAEHIELEITESVLLNPENSAIRSLYAMREAGCRITLDDFGTGYSSLAYLQLLDFDCLKIDKSFISHLAFAPHTRRGRNGAAIITAMVTLAHQLDYEVVAEGVESATQYDWLRRLGCDAAQGYWLSRPIPAEEFATRFLDAEPIPSATRGKIVPLETNRSTRDRP